MDGPADGLDALLRIPGAYVAASVAQIPVVPGAFYGVDLDDTLLYTRAHKRAWHVTYTTTAMDGAVDWTQRVASVAHLCYITARDHDTDFTKGQLAGLGFPDAPIVFALFKGPAFALRAADYAVSYFVDDLDANIRSVRAQKVGVCVRVDAHLWDKLMARSRKKMLEARAE